MNYDFEYILSGENDSQNISNIIKEYGICVIKNTNANVENIKSECFSILDKTPKSGYEFGHNARFENKQSYQSYNEINNYFNQSLFGDILNDYSPNHGPFNEKMFITHDYVSEKLARNGYLHFDRQHCFKFFLYLTDVTENDGPFSVVPKTHLKGKEIRDEAWRIDNHYRNVKNRIDVDYLDIYNENEIVPILGEAGTLIIFDTNLFHKGGETKGGERLVIRSHTYIDYGK